MTRGQPERGDGGDRRSGSRSAEQGRRSTTSSGGISQAEPGERELLAVEPARPGSAAAPARGSAYGPTAPAGRVLHPPEPEPFLAVAGRGASARRCAAAAWSGDSRSSASARSGSAGSEARRRGGRRPRPTSPPASERQLQPGGHRGPPASRRAPRNRGSGLPGRHPPHPDQRRDVRREQQRRGCTWPIGLRYGLDVRPRTARGRRGRRR